MSVHRERGVAMLRFPRLISPQTPSAVPARCPIAVRWCAPPRWPLPVVWGAIETGSRARAHPAHQAAVGQHAQMLGDRLARDRGTGRELGDRTLAAVAEPRQQSEADLVAQGGKQRGAGRAIDAGRYFGLSLTYCSMFCTWMVQPPSFMRNASSRRPGGILSKPDSVTTSRVPVGVGVSVNVTNVGGSCE